MYVHRMHFTVSDAAGWDKDRCLDVAHRLLGAWRHSGQLSRNELPIFEEADGYATVAPSPEGNSLDERFNSGYVEAEVAGLTMVWESLGEDPESWSICACERSTAYVLSTNFICLESPVRCTDCFGPVPFYRFDAKGRGDFCDLVSW